MLIGQDVVHGALSLQGSEHLMPHSRSLWFSREECHASVSSVYQATGCQSMQLVCMTVYQMCLTGAFCQSILCNATAGCVCYPVQIFMQGCTPLHTAAATEKAESVRLLLTYGADVGAIDKQVSFGRMTGNLCCVQFEICHGTVIICRQTFTQWLSNSFIHNAA